MKDGSIGLTLWLGGVKEVCIMVGVAKPMARVYNWARGFVNDALFFAIKKKQGDGKSCIGFFFLILHTDFKHQIHAKRKNIVCKPGDCAIYC